MLKGSWTTISYALQLLVVFILTISMLSSNPLDNTRKQWLVPNKIWLTRLVDPLTQKIKWDAKSTLPQFTLVADQKNKDTKNLHEFVEKYTFTEDTDQTTFDEIAKNPLSPMTRAMLMMGCYGNLKDITAGRSLESLTSQSTAVLFNILLDIWETKSLQAPGNPQEVLPPVAPRYDRSVCSCMRDFASPLVINYQKGAETPYTHDTCTIQQVVDYASATKESQDPMLSELNAYFKVFEARYFVITGNSQYNASTAWKNVSVTEAKNAYEPFKLFMELLEPNAPSFKTLGELKTYLDKYVQTKMYSHNKLRTPKYNAAADLSKMPAEINAESYEVYMQKYRSAYQVCAVTGVPNYQTKPIMKIIASKYGRIGVTFLLAAAIFGFSTVFRRKIFETSQEEQDKYTNTKMTFNVITTLFKVVIFITLIVFLFTISVDSTDDKNVMEKENAVRFVIALLWVLGFVTGCIFIVDSIDDFSSEDTDVFASHQLVLKQIGQDVSIIAGLASLAVAFRLQRGDSDEYVFLACFSLFVVIGLLQHMSNLVRMMQQYVQEQLRKKYDPNATEKDKSKNPHVTYRIAYNRVLVTVIVAIGLVAYLTIATSTIQAWTPDIIYAEQHTRLFAFCAFFIFSAYDIFFEILVAVKYDQADLEKQHPRKMMWTSWTIVVSILFLNMHQFFALCYGRQSMADEGACKLQNYMFD
jgi:hypothetical protein